ncbi:hypothetical protein OIU78_010100 [Salix suchowensis]|nr:hypothetical protein OIU78_010100 [Salix suchowensis]
MILQVLGSSNQQNLPLVIAHPGVTGESRITHSTTRTVNQPYKTKNEALLYWKCKNILQIPIKSLEFQSHFLMLVVITETSSNKQQKQDGIQFIFFLFV